MVVRMHEALNRPGIPVLQFDLFTNQQSAVFLYVILQIKGYYFTVLAFILRNVSGGVAIQIIVF